MPVMEAPVQDTCRQWTYSAASWLAHPKGLSDLYYTYTPLETGSPQEAWVQVIGDKLPEQPTPRQVCVGNSPPGLRRQWLSHSGAVTRN